MRRVELLDDGIVDEVAVERVVRGDRTVRLTRRERIAAFLELDRRGFSAPAIAELLDTTPRSVTRWRAEAVAA